MNLFVPQPPTPPPPPLPQPHHLLPQPPLLLPRPPDSPTPPPWSLTFSPTLFPSLYTGHIFRWDLATKKVLNSLNASPTHASAVSSLTFTADLKYTVSCNVKGWAFLHTFTTFLGVSSVEHSLLQAETFGEKVLTVKALFQSTPSPPPVILIAFGFASKIVLASVKPLFETLYCVNQESSAIDPPMLEFSLVQFRMDHPPTCCLTFSWGLHIRFLHVHVVPHVGTHVGDQVGSSIATGSGPGADFKFRLVKAFMSEVSIV